MAIDHSTLERTAHLARIRLEEGDAEDLNARLNDILGLVDQLERADVDGVEPMAHPLDLNQPLRPDRVTASDHRERILRLAPAEQDGCFLVPRVIE